MTGSEIAEREAAGELTAPLSPDEQKLVDSAKSRIDRTKLVLPTVKLTHSLTKEVEAGHAEAGEWINSLTGENYGPTVEVVVASLFDGRFYSEKGQNYPAQGDVAPDTWPPEYAGQRFEDLPDAEEQWKIDSNNNVHPFGKGPPISTTHNFVGIVVGSDSDLPVRISLMRSGNKTAFKLQTMLYASRAPWDRSYVFGVTRGTNSENQGYFVPTVEQGSVTEPELRQAAVELAQEFQTAHDAGNVELAGDEGEGKARKASATSKGAGLDVK